ncbi:MAG: helix-hairpin-helix domain-containing protein, partial [Minisyncoccales bacterium]
MNKELRNLTLIEGLEKQTAENLRDAAFTTLKEIADADIEKLASIKGIGQKRAKKFKRRARKKWLDLTDFEDLFLIQPYQKSKRRIQKELINLRQKKNLLETKLKKIQKKIERNIKYISKKGFFKNNKIGKTKIKVTEKLNSVKSKIKIKEKLLSYNKLIVSGIEKTKSHKFHKALSLFKKAQNEVQNVPELSEAKKNKVNRYINILHLTEFDSHISEKSHQKVERAIRFIKKIKSRKSSQQKENYEKVITLINILKRMTLSERVLTKIKMSSIEKNLRKKLNTAYSAYINKNFNKARDQLKKNNLKKSLKTSKKLLTIAHKITETSVKETEVKRIRNVLDKTYVLKINNRIESSKELAKNNNFDEAIKILKESVKFAHNLSDPKVEDKEIKKLKDFIKRLEKKNNSQIERLIKKGKVLNKQSEFKKAIKIFEKVNAILNQKKTQKSFNYKKSDYPFKSPHWKMKEWTKILNHLNSVAGDSRRLPTDTPRGKTKWEYRETAKYKKVSDEIVEMMRDFMNLSSYSSLHKLQKVLPLRYVYVLPVRHAVVIYSAYSMLISKEQGKPASYSEIQKYLGVPIDQTKSKVYSKTKMSEKKNFLAYNLISNYFRLFKISKPFRYLLGLSVKPDFLMIRKYEDVCDFRKNKKRVEEMKKYIEFHRKKNNSIENVEEWKKVSSPSKILITVHDLLKKFGFKLALQIVRYLFRVSRKIKRILTSEEIDWDQIIGLTKRYLSLNNDRYFQALIWEEDIHKKIRKNLNLAYSEYINKNFWKARDQLKKNNLKKSLKTSKELLTIAYKISDPSVKETEVKKLRIFINKVYCLIIHNRIKSSEELTKNNNFDEAIKILKESVKIAHNLSDPKGEDSEVKRIRNLIDKTYVLKINNRIKSSEELTKNNNFDEA